MQFLIIYNLLTVLSCLQYVRVRFRQCTCKTLISHKTVKHVMWRDSSACDFKRVSFLNQTIDQWRRGGNRSIRRKPLTICPVTFSTHRWENSWKRKWARKFKKSSSTPVDHGHLRWKVSKVWKKDCTAWTSLHKMLFLLSRDRSTSRRCAFVWCGLKIVWFFFLLLFSVCLCEFFTDLFSIVCDPCE